MKFNKVFLLMFLLSISSFSYGFSGVSENEAEIMTSIASGRMIDKDKAAAIVSVILEKDIKKIGAFSIEEVLETIPGLHVVKNSYVRSNKYIFRGIGSTFNQEVLFLINNVPIKSNGTGNRTNAGFGGMPVNNIKRIEVIRGPNSALYGADAYSGIINIVLKENNGENGSYIQARHGELNTNSIFLENSFRKNDFNLYLSLDYENTDGNDSVVDYDYQSYLDEIYGTNVSLAPTSPNFEKEIIDFYINLNYKNFNFFHLNQNRRNMGSGFNFNDVISKDGSFDNNRSLSKITFVEKNDDMEINFNISYFLMEEKVNKFDKIYPDGAFGGLFPNGAVSSPERTEQNLNTDFKILYSGYENHYVQFGFGASENKIFDIKDYRNFDSETMTPFPDGIVDVSGDSELSFLTPRSRENYYLFIQDEFYFEKDWILTTGLRYDYYNDFGSTINPRLALVWNTDRKLTTKILYGRAFRAPSFSELYVKSNPIAEGNESLNAATIDTYEISFNYSLNTKGSINWNLFYYDAKDQIEPSTDGSGNKFFENIGETEGYGTELEFNYKVNNHLEVYSNYSYQQSYNKLTDERNIIHPEHLFYTRVSLNYLNWFFNLQSNFVGERKRARNDNRENLESYHKLDLNITRKNILDINGLNAKIYIKNLTNEDVREPSISGGIKNDYPMQGRNSHIELSYKF